MFYGCKGLTSLDVSSFNTQLVEDMSDMFHDCEALTTFIVMILGHAKCLSACLKIVSC